MARRGVGRGPQDRKEDYIEKLKARATGTPYVNKPNFYKRRKKLPSRPNPPVPRSVARRSGRARPPDATVETKSDDDGANDELTQAAIGAEDEATAQERNRRLAEEIGAPVCLWGGADVRRERDEAMDPEAKRPRTEAPWARWDQSSENDSAAPRPAPPVLAAPSRIFERLRAGAAERFALRKKLIADGVPMASVEEQVSALYQRQKAAAEVAEAPAPDDLQAAVVPDGAAGVAPARLVAASTAPRTAPQPQSAPPPPRPPAPRTAPHTIDLTLEDSEDGRFNVVEVSDGGPASKCAGGVVRDAD